MSTWYITPFRIWSCSIFFYNKRRAFIWRNNKNGFSWGTVRSDAAQCGCFQNWLKIEAMRHPLQCGRTNQTFDFAVHSGNLGGDFKCFFFTMFHPYLAKWSNLTNILQIGWNHHLEMIWIGRTQKKQWIQGGSWWTCIARKLPGSIKYSCLPCRTSRSSRVSLVCRWNQVALIEQLHGLGRERLRTCCEKRNFTWLQHAVF